MSALLKATEKQGKVRTEKCQFSPMEIIDDLGRVHFVKWEEIILNLFYQW